MEISAIAHSSGVIYGCLSSQTRSTIKDYAHQGVGLLDLTTSEFTMFYRSAIDDTIVCHDIIVSGG